MVKKFYIVIVFVLVILPGIADSQEIGLVLSGGGAKGLAHIGVIRALEEHGIPIDYVTGTSMGGIIGALYASGYSPDEMEDIVYTEQFMSWSTGRIPEEYYYYYKNRHSNSSMISFEFSRIDSVTVPVFPTNIIPTHSMDLGLLELFAQSSAASGYDFDNLMIPFRCVASDVYANRSVVHRHGELSSAVRTSMTYPFYFKPIEVDSVLLFDGGIHNNFPFDVMMEDFSPDVMIGSKASANAPRPTPDDIRSQIENLITARTDYDIEKAGGILIDSEIPDVGVLEFRHAARIISAGYNNTIKNIDRIKEKVQQRISSEEINQRREEFKNKLPALIFENIYVVGTNRYQIDYVINSIRQKEEYFTIDRLKAEYYKLVSDDKIASIYPRAVLNSETGVFDLHLDIKSENRLVVELGGNISSTSINQGYAGVEYKLLGRNSYNLEGNIYFGRLYSSVLTRAKIEYPGSIPLYGDIGFALNRWDFFSSSGEPFFEDIRPSYLIQYDGNLKINVGAPVGINGLAQIGYSIGRLSDRYYQSGIYTESDTTDRTDFDLNAISIFYNMNNLNYEFYATRGRKANVGFKFVRGIEKFSPGSTSLLPGRERNEHLIIRMEAGYQNFVRVFSEFSLGFSGELVLSSQSFFTNYTATLLNSPSYSPFPHGRTLFIENYHAHNFAGVGLIPVYGIRDNLHLRIEAYLFQPYRKIVYDEKNLPIYREKLADRHFLGNASIVYQTPVGPVSLGLNYYDKSGQKFYVVFNFGYIMFNQKAL